jgi:hypothetical protein
MPDPCRLIYDLKRLAAATLAWFDLSVVVAIIEGYSRRKDQFMVGMSLGSVNSVSVSGKGENSGGTSVFVCPACPRHPQLGTRNSSGPWFIPWIWIVTRDRIIRASEAYVDLRPSVTSTTRPRDAHMLTPTVRLNKWEH